MMKNNHILLSSLEVYFSFQRVIFMIQFIQVTSRFFYIKKKRHARFTESHMQIQSKTPIHLKWLKSTSSDHSQKCTGVSTRILLVTVSYCQPYTQKLQINRPIVSHKCKRNVWNVIMEEVDSIHVQTDCRSKFLEG